MQILKDPTQTQAELHKKFTVEIKSKLPHLGEGGTGKVIVNATPLVDITGEVIDCARTELGMELSSKNPKVFGKFDSEIYGGSVKARPAARMIEDAIASGKLSTGKVVFEATSGNFGIALGILSGLGFDIVTLVSRKLQPGVVRELEKSGVKLVNLDIDICPAPGLKIDTGLLVAKTVASSIRDQLANLGLNTAAFDASRVEIEQLLARQDIINLAKLLAKVYNGFCPEQYDNELNAEVHETVTAPEIDQQLSLQGYSLADFKVVCTFGTGGTSTGIARYQKAKYEKTGVHVVFPLGTQDVGGIRTRDKAAGLRLYRPELYAGEHEVDFEPARRVLKFFVGRGYNIGESSALAIYASIQMLNYGAGQKFIVMVADGSQKYSQNLKATSLETKSHQVTLQEARSGIAGYAGILWTHTMFAPKQDGIKALAASLGCHENDIKIAQARDVEQFLTRQEIPASLQPFLPASKGKVLLVCMVGGTSLKFAKLLEDKGIDAESLTGGIMGVPENNGKPPSELVQVARQ